MTTAGIAAPEAANAPPSGRMERLRRRAEFLAAARGRRAATRSLVLQMLPNGMNSIRIGFTVTRKVGNSVERNRVRRRLRDAVRREASACAVPGSDYVVIGRRAALTLPFEKIVSDLRNAFARVAKASPERAAEAGQR